MNSTTMRDLLKIPGERGDQWLREAIETSRAPGGGSTEALRWTELGSTEQQLGEPARVGWTDQTQDERERSTEQDRFTHQRQQ